MQIRPDQMLMFAPAMQSSFLVRVASFIHAKTNRKPEIEALTDLYGRAAGYELVTEQQFVGYMIIAWAAGTRPGLADPAWIGEVLKDPYRTAADKIETIFRHADAARDQQAAR